MKAKRVFDFIIASLLLILCLPLMVVIAILIRINMGPPIFFNQIRPGLHGKCFNIYKFRTMENAIDDHGNSLPDAARLTPLGKCLRALSLDELPQLYNICRGEMSLVGPRPLLLKYIPYYSDREKMRHNVRPGLTGLAQISGRNLLSWDERLELDAQYVANWTFGLDIKILWLTLLRVISKHGVVAAADTVLLDLDKARELR